MRRVTAALETFGSADDAISKLDAARRLREAADELELAEVDAARKAGCTWVAIGACYGLTKQGAQQRFRPNRSAAKVISSEPKRKRPGS